MAPKEEQKHNAAATADNQKGNEVAPKQDEQKAPAAWGNFKIETGIVPERAGGVSKYDWASFPAPSNPDDPQTWPSVFIPDIGGKTIYNSINKYREKVQAAGGTAPEFTVSVSKDPKGVRVIRKS